MRVPLLLSVLLHLAVVVVAVIGVPWSGPRVVAPARVIDVEVVEATETPDPKPETEPAPPPKAETPKPPPPPPPPRPPEAVALAAPVESERAPEPRPEPEDEPEPVPPPPEPKAEPVPKPAPPKPKVERKPTPVRLPPRPRPKPKPPRVDDFSSVLKTVERLRKRPPVRPPQKPEKKKAEPFEEQVAAALRRRRETPVTPAQRARLGPAMTISELDAVRRQIERCWAVPVGAKEVEDLAVEIQVVLNPDGTVRMAEVDPKYRYQMALNPFFRAVAESALRAVRNPRCSPLRLPPEKYSEWKSMVLRFDPREMVGR